jgi:hypothetical protein
MREVRNSERCLRAAQLFSETQNEGEAPKLVTQTLIADHPIGAVDPNASQLFELAMKALSAEFGDNVTFRITMPRPGCLLEGVCGSSACCEQMLDRLAAVPEIKECPITNFAAKFIRLGCPCTADGECHCAAQASCGASCAAGTTSSCKCCPCAGQVTSATCNGETCGVKELVVKQVEHHKEAAPLDSQSLLKHIAELMAEKAAAQAALDVRKESEERFSQLFEAMAEVIADNAALDAKLEGQIEQRKLLEKVAELATENARLKAQVELAAEKAEIARSTNLLTLENERLKLRLADLEHKHAAAEAGRPIYTRVIAKYPDGRVEIEEEAARTAARPSRERKPR